MRRWIPWLVALAFVSPVVAPSTSTAEGNKPSRARKAGDKKKPRKKAKSKTKRASKTSPASRRSETRKHVGSPRPAILTILEREIHCPSDMVAVAGRVCVDRFETSLVDAVSGKAWSPFYPPDLARATESFVFYRDARDRAPERSLDALMPLPPVPTWSPKAKAVSAQNVLPQGYLNADQAQAACQEAGKRLCTEAEWLTACRGEDNREFPYGAAYEQGTCNVYRENHPSALLHNNASRYHDDPRNNLVVFEGKSLLQKTGAAPRCASRWGNDAIMDMVGNLDEWVDDQNGVFVGGFYSRGTRAGCFSRIDAHPRGYSDYSTGTRCCADPIEKAAAVDP